ncbi:hypothetical protein MRB53_022985 [Persea americana]|uniref:Uncharacterized protein n=1 Tax=Persea americana TaxID=3435 RepID=A0ACC2L8I1_PERAE|nr:hypothetical protein MRB53_022985 [Persea americana]
MCDIGEGLMNYREGKRADALKREKTVTNHCSREKRGLLRFGAVCSCRGEWVSGPRHLVFAELEKKRGQPSCSHRHQRSHRTSLPEAIGSDKEKVEPGIAYIYVADRM